MENDALRQQVLDKMTKTCPCRVVTRARIKEARQSIFDSLEEGQKIHGKVTKIMPYGAFIDIGEGLEGLAHINNLSWKRVESVEDVVAEGQMFMY